VAKVTIHLKDKEHHALNELALREYRSLPAQAAIIIHRQLQDLGLLPVDETLKSCSNSTSMDGAQEA
jgi:hypothetical protein